jgi:hypothetical protein
MVYTFNAKLVSGQGPAAQTCETNPCCLYKALKALHSTHTASRCQRATHCLNAVDHRCTAYTVLQLFLARHLAHMLTMQDACRDWLRT